jgi:hypothetical protein
MHDQVKLALDFQQPRTVPRWVDRKDIVEQRGQEGASRPDRREDLYRGRGSTYDYTFRMRFRET